MLTYVIETELSTVESHYSKSQGTLKFLQYVSEIHYNQLQFHSRIITGSHDFIHTHVHTHTHAHTHTHTHINTHTHTHTNT